MNAINISYLTEHCYYCYAGHDVFSLPLLIIKFISVKTLNEIKK